MRLANVDMTSPRSSAAVTEPQETPPPRARAPSVLRRYADLIVPCVLIALGVAITLAALGPQTTTTYATYFVGTASPGNVILPLPSSEAGYLDINLTQGDCSLRVYPATDAQWASFNASGVLPPTWIDCADRATTTTGDVHDLILVESGPNPTPYNVTVTAYAVETPYGWVALPGAGLALAGLLVIVPRIVFEKATRMRDEEEKKWEKWK